LGCRCCARSASSSFAGGPSHSPRGVARVRRDGCKNAGREVVRPADRDAPLGAERELRRRRPTLGPRRPGGSAPHRRPDHPAGWAEPEPGTCSRRAGTVVSAVGTPGVGAAGSGAGGSECQAWAVERPESHGAMGLAEKRCRSSKATRYPSGWRGLSALDLQHGRRAGRSQSPGSKSGCATFPRSGGKRRCERTGSEPGCPKCGCQVFLCLQAGGVFDNSKALDTSRIHNQVHNKRFSCTKGHL
jgi:hypothetical protein